jgi:hypothetical protein
MYSKRCESPSRDEEGCERNRDNHAEDSIERSSPGKHDDDDDGGMKSCLSSHDFRHQVGHGPNRAEFQKFFQSAIGQARELHFLSPSHIAPPGDYPELSCRAHFQRLKFGSNTKFVRSP